MKKNETPRLWPLHGWLARRTGLGEGLTPAALEAWQWGRLRELLALLQKRSRHYAPLLHGVDPAAVTTPRHLARLPFTLPEQLRADPESFVCVSQQNIARVITLATSGTSGRPKRVFFSEGDLELCTDFFTHGLRPLVKAGERVDILLGRPVPGGTVDLLRRALERLGARPFLHNLPLDPHALPLLSRETVCVLGHPVTLLHMAEAQPCLRPRAVLLCADYAPPPVARRIAALWGCAVHRHYGSTESGLGGGVECAAHNGYHWRHADLLLEIIHPQRGVPVPPGTWGEVVFTTLSREAMPLLRYRTGDVGRILADPCPCGCPLPRLDRVAGRVQDRLPLPGGGDISIQQLDDILFAFPDLRDYRARLRQGCLELDVWLPSLGPTGQTDGPRHPGSLPACDAACDPRLEPLRRHVAAGLEALRRASLRSPEDMPPASGFLPEPLPEPWSPPVPPPVPPHMSPAAARRGQPPSMAPGLRLALRHAAAWPLTAAKRAWEA